jgi:thermitase
VRQVSVLAVALLWAILLLSLAPGANILSTSAGGGYNEQSGTSEAAPFVSALAGLLASEGKTATKIRQRMQSTADDDPSYGHGRIDTNAAVP